jgi:hypothetical protein
LIEVPPAEAQYPAATDVVDEVDPWTELIVFQHGLLVVTQSDLRGQTLEEPHPIGGIEGVVLTRELVLVKPGQLTRRKAGIVDPVPDQLVVQVVVGGVVAAQLEAPLEIVIARQLMVPILPQPQYVQDTVVDQHQPFLGGRVLPIDRPVAVDALEGEDGVDKSPLAEQGLVPHPGVLAAVAGLGIESLVTVHLVEEQRVASQ